MNNQSIQSKTEPETQKKFTQSFNNTYDNIQTQQQTFEIVGWLQNKEYHRQIVYLLFLFSWIEIMKIEIGLTQETAWNISSVLFPRTEQISHTKSTEKSQPSPTIKKNDEKITLDSIEKP